MSEEELCEKIFRLEQENGKLKIQVDRLAKRLSDYIKDKDNCFINLINGDCDNQKSCYDCVKNYFKE